ncbi:hypothetical protein F2Q69_00013708 [Brassica cretica]|uniref:Uncharacterized protein n=1 Tax=Brassica cretica TaxID=69181 RepID=A0A8S9R5X3_BRACR|nr:hypothetical protein F2Q69_00013708 [Brassica cretica]
MAVSVNLWVRFIRIAGSNTRDNPSRLVVEAEYAGLNKVLFKPGTFGRLTRPAKSTLRCLWSLRVALALTRFYSGIQFYSVGNSDVSGSENRGRDQSDTATGSERGDTDESGRSPTPLRQSWLRCHPDCYGTRGLSRGGTCLDLLLPIIP